MHNFYGAERVAEMRRHDLLEQADAERRARLAVAERAPRPRLRVGRLVLEFGFRVVEFAGAALRPSPRKTA